MAKRVRILEFPHDNRIWRIDWLAAVQRNDNVPTESTIEVYLRPVDLGQLRIDFGVHIQERVCCLIGVGQLPVLVIGSLWHNGCLMSDEHAIRRYTELSHVQINSKTVKLIPAGHKHNEQYVINKFKFDVGGYSNGLSANCLAIEYNGDPYGIIIPVAEVIRFYYAASSDLSKVAFSGMYEHDFDEMVGWYEFDSVLNRLAINRRFWLEDSDCWTIGRLLLEPRADEAFKQIHRSLVKQSLNVPHKKSMPETNFPFEGSTNWTGRCLPFLADGKTRLLVLELTHCTAPFPFNELEVIPDNNGSKANPETDLPDDEKIECWATKEVTKPNSDGLALQSESEPYRYATKNTITLNANRFAALEDKKIIKTLKEQCKYKAAQLIPSQVAVATGLGTGLGTTGNSTIIPTQITTSAEDEERIRRQREKALEASFDVMMQAVGLLNQYPNTTAAIRQSDNGYFVPLTSPKNFQWAYLDSKIKQRRSVFVADIQVDARYFWLIEFDQRKGEHFTSALVEIPEHYSDDELLQLLKLLAIKEGRWRKIERQFDFRVIPMKHTWNSAEGYASSVHERCLNKV